MISWLETHLSACFFKSHFGIECPGCGMQRAFIALLKGDIVSSFHYHPALIPFIITLIAVIIQIKVQHVKGGKLILGLFILTTLITVINYAFKVPIYFHTN